MRVEWFEKALKNLEDEANYIALENPKAADDFSDAISPASTDWLGFLPWEAKVG
ncbi:plasmid stabilization system protein ParE [Pseudomonas synxantha]|nr:plasmid stabilization system protein ParE [Pseudomonas synxantha]